MCSHIPFFRLNTQISEDEMDRLKCYFDQIKYLEIRLMFHDDRVFMLP